MKTRYFKVLMEDGDYSIFAKKRTREKCLHSTISQGDPLYKDWTNPTTINDASLEELIPKNNSYRTVTEISEEDAFLEMV
ncbi:MAG: hypothetical protein GY861_29265 [bacterium]|nr:hypothetical protein [bacterium]